MKCKNTIIGSHNANVIFVSNLPTQIVIRFIEIKRRNELNSIIFNASSL